MQQGIWLELVWRDAEVLEISVRARNASFAGSVCVYTSAEQLRTFAERIEGFPSASSDEQDTILGGFGPKWAGGAVSMRFFCEDSVGHSFVEVQLESGQRTADVAEFCRILLSIEASGIDRFVPQIEALARFTGHGHLTSGPVAVLPAWYPSAEEMLREDRSR